MIPIHSLLARIHWDPEFGRGRWEIAYLDRSRSSLVRLPVERMRTQPGVRFVFDVVDEDGVSQSIPYHRVREVRRDGKVVWSRLAPRTTTHAKKAPRTARRRKAPPPRIRRAGT